MKVFKSKALTLGILILCFLYFTNDFGLIDIEKTSIVVALGVDYRGDLDEYFVTAQIATPKSSAEMTVQNEKRTINASGKTVSEAIENIGAATGWYPMLSFCELLLIGEVTTQKNLMDVVSFFLRSDDIPDSALIAAAENSAAETLSSPPVLENVTAIAIEKIISDAQKSKLVAMSNVKDFAQGYYSHSGCSFMPVIKKITEKSAKDEGGEESGNEKFIFDATSTRVFSYGKSAFDLNKEETFIFNLITNGCADVMFPVSDVVIGDKPCDVIFKVKGINSDKKLTLGETPKYEINLGLSLVIADADGAIGISKLHPAAKIPENALKKAEKKIADAFYAIFEKSVDGDCDLFKLKDFLYKYDYDNYGTYADSLPKKATAEIRVKCTSRG